MDLLRCHAGLLRQLHNQGRDPGAEARAGSGCVLSTHGRQLCGIAGGESWLSARVIETRCKLAQLTRSWERTTFESQDCRETTGHHRNRHLRQRRRRPSWLGDPQPQPFHLLSCPGCRSIRDQQNDLPCGPASEDCSRTIGLCLPEIGHLFLRRDSTPAERRRR